MKYGFTFADAGPKAKDEQCFDGPFNHPCIQAYPWGSCTSSVSSVWSLLLIGSGTLMQVSCMGSPPFFRRSSCHMSSARLPTDAERHLRRRHPELCRVGYPILPEQKQTL